MPCRPSSGACGVRPRTVATAESKVLAYVTRRHDQPASSRVERSASLEYARQSFRSWRNSRPAGSNEQRPVGRSHATKLTETQLDIVFRHVLKHVVQRDEVERAVLERKRGQRGDCQLGLRHPLTRKLDRRRPDVHTADALQLGAIQGPTQEASGATTGVEQPRACCEPSSQKRLGDREHAAVPPVALLRLVDPAVVVLGDPGCVRRFHHRARVIRRSARRLPPAFASPFGQANLATIGTKPSLEAALDLIDNEPSDGAWSNGRVGTGGGRDKSRVRRAGQARDAGASQSIKGHDVMGYDIDPSRMQKDGFPHREMGRTASPRSSRCLRESRIRFGSLDDVVAHAEIVFVAVQTPHEPEYEGTTRLPDERVDFDYGWLKGAVGSLSEAIARRVKTGS